MISKNVPHNCPTAGTIVTGLLESEHQKRNDIAILLVEADTRNAQKSQQFLIDYWLSIGKIGRERKVEGDPRSRWVYYFISDDGSRDLSLNTSWTKFFQFFDEMNLFFQFFELGAPAYDPWNDPQWIQMVITGGQRIQRYRCIGQLL